VIKGDFYTSFGYFQMRRIFLGRKNIVKAGDQIIGTFERSGTMSDVSAPRLPFIKVGAANGLGWNANLDPSPPNRIDGLVALVDTGADYCRVDGELTTRLKLIKQGSVRSMSVGSAQEADVFAMVLCFGKENYPIRVSAPAANLRGAGLLFDIIIGQDVLKFFQFRMIPKTYLVELTFRGI
jgi:hypothetical protein